MQQPPLPDFRKLLMTPEEKAAEIVAAIACGTLVVQLNSVYEDLLKQTIFPHPMPGHDAKDLLKYQRLLLDNETCSELLVVWRESPYVTDDDLALAKQARHFSGEVMTAYGLAKRLAVSTQDLSKVNSRIQSVATAAEAYGLVERGSPHVKNRPLVATQRLNEFVLKLSSAQLGLIADHMKSVSLGNVGLGLQQQ